MVASSHGSHHLYVTTTPPPPHVSVLVTMEMVTIQLPAASLTSVYSFSEGYCREREREREREGGRERERDHAIVQLLSYSA